MEVGKCLDLLIKHVKLKNNRDGNVKGWLSFSLESEPERRAILDKLRWLVTWILHSNFLFDLGPVLKDKRTPFGNQLALALFFFFSTCWRPGL